MESTTKTKLTREDLECLVWKQFGCGLKDYSESGEGMMNSIYRIRLERPVPDQEVILKVSYFPGKEILTYEREIMRAEVLVYQLLEGKGVPIPKVLCHDFSHTMLDADYFFMTPVFHVQEQFLLLSLPPGQEVLLSHPELLLSHRHNRYL